MILCMNLCELLHATLLDKINLRLLFDSLEKKYCESVKRVYIGSSFCSQYFLNFFGYHEVFNYCREKKIPVTLTVPVLSEKDLKKGKEKINRVCLDGVNIIDEITVNDIGMLAFLNGMSTVRLNLGRLFFKDPRDCRVPDYMNENLPLTLLTHLSDNYWSRLRFEGIELDPIKWYIDLSLLNGSEYYVGLHVPFCYMTTGNICKFASVHYPVEQKFRPNLSCGMECEHIIDFYSGHVMQTDCDPLLIRIGRTLYFENEHVKTIGQSFDRIIYFPVKEWKEFIYENPSPVK